MKYYNNSLLCIRCTIGIEGKVHEYSMENFEVSLCRDCQDWLRDMEHMPTPEALKLFFELKKRRVPAQLEKFDGYKTIDIAVPDAKINIEVDGMHHNSNPKQAIADLKRTYYSFKKGYFTLRIPNALINNNLEDTADMITEFLSEGKEQKIKKYRS